MKAATKRGGSLLEFLDRFGSSGCMCYFSRSLNNTFLCFCLIHGMDMLTGLTVRLSMPPPLVFFSFIVYLYMERTLL